MEDPGPRKGFLDHLEDLRWTLVKCASAIMVAVIICLFLGPKLVWVFERPLRHMNMFQPSGPPTMSIELGDTNLGPYKLKPGEVVGGQTLSNGDHGKLKLVPIIVDGKELLALKPEPAPAPDSSADIKLRNLSPSEGFLVT